MLNNLLFTVGFVFSIILYDITKTPFFLIIAGACLGLRLKYQMSISEIKEKQFQRTKKRFYKRSWIELILSIGILGIYFVSKI